jgi:VWFA-related protein
LSRLPRNEIAKQLIGKLKKDITLGAAPYKTLIREIEAMVQGITGGGSEGALLMLRDLLMRIEQYRYIDENKLIAFAEFLKAKKGQKNVFLFYQKELLPQIDLTNPEILLTLSGNPANPGELLDILEITEHFKRDITFNVDRIQKLFSDSSILVHFLFLTKTKMVGLDVERQAALSQLGVRYVDHSEDIYGAFNEVALATGGFTTSSYNPESAFLKAVEATENYYLVYYTPKNYRTDGKFHTIKVNVRRKGLRVTHRSGYFSN